MAVLDRLWTDELTDGEADHVADWTYYFSNLPDEPGDDEPPNTRWEEICAFSGVKAGNEIPNLMEDVARASTMQKEALRFEAWRKSATMSMSKQGGR